MLSVLEGDILCINHISNSKSKIDIDGKLYNGLKKCNKGHLKKSYDTCIITVTYSFFLYKGNFFFTMKKTCLDIFFVQDPFLYFLSKYLSMPLGL